MAKNNPAPVEGTVDSEAPATVILEIRSPQGEPWGQIVAQLRTFKTGSVGYYASGKVTNPKSGARYQLGSNVILIGSKK